MSRERLPNIMSDGRSPEGPDNLTRKVAEDTQRAFTGNSGRPDAARSRFSSFMRGLGGEPEPDPDPTPTPPGGGLPARREAPLTGTGTPAGDNTTSTTNIPGDGAEYPDDFPFNPNKNGPKTGVGGIWGHVGRNLERRVGKVAKAFDSVEGAARGVLGGNVDSGRGPEIPYERVQETTPPADTARPEGPAQNVPSADTVTDAVFTPIDESTPVAPAAASVRRGVIGLPGPVGGGGGEPPADPPTAGAPDTDTPDDDEPPGDPSNPGTSGSGRRAGRKFRSPLSGGRRRAASAAGGAGGRGSVPPRPPVDGRPTGATPPDGPRRPSPEEEARESERLAAFAAELLKRVGFNPYEGTNLGGPDGMNLNLPRSERVPPPEGVQAQIDWVSSKMSLLEALNQSYNSVGVSYHPSFRELLINVPYFHPEVQGFFSSRMAIYEAWMGVGDVKGDIEPFVGLVNKYGAMILSDTMLQRPEVARAMMSFESKSKVKPEAGSLDAGPLMSTFVRWENVKDPQTGQMKRVAVYSFDSSQNPAFADELEMIDIRTQMALDLAIEIGSPEDRERALTAKGSSNESVKRAALEEVVPKYVWGVRQAETIWRMWMRSALLNGVVFKGPNPEWSEELQDNYRAGITKLASLKPQELRNHWELLQGVIDWKNSFKKNSNAEFAVKRLLHAALFAESSKYGKPRMRPSVFYGSQDFVSSYLDEGFITSSRNFRDGEAFTFEQNLGAFSDPSIDRTQPGWWMQPDRSDDRVYVKNVKDARGNIIGKDRVILRRTGVVDVINLHYDKVKWIAKGPDALTGRFKAYKLILAEGLRKKLFGTPDSISRTPGLGALIELKPALEHLPTIEADLQEGKNPDIERLHGVIYKEDMFTLFAEAMLLYQRWDMRDDYKTKNLGINDILTAISLIRNQAMITDDQAAYLRRETTRVAGVNLGPGAHVVGGLQSINPAASLGSGAMELLAQGMKLL